MNYLIVYDNTQTEFDPSDIHNTITNLPNITDWWHYLPNVYIVTTVQNANSLANAIIKVHSSLRFLVMKVELTDYNGVLNKNAWEWIRKKTGSQLLYDILSSAKGPLMSPSLSSSANRLLRSKQTRRSALEEARRGTSILDVILKKSRDK